MKKVTVLQKNNERYTFILDPEKKTMCGRYTIRIETNLTTGSDLLCEQTTKESGNALYKRLISQGFTRFNSLDEVRW